jgi:hypothetical protein
MPALAAPFPHLDAIQALYDRAAGHPAAGDAAPLGRVLFGVPFVTAGSLMWPAEHAHRVLHEWAQWTRTVPHDVTSVARLVRLPHLPVVPRELRGRALVVVEVAIPREPWVAAGRLAALRRLEPEIDTVAVRDPDAIHPLHTGAEVPAPAIGDLVCLEALPAAAVDAFLAVVGPNSGSNLLTAGLRHLGLAYGAFAAGIGTDPDEASRLDVRLALLTGRLAPYTTGRPAVEDIVRAVGRTRMLLRGEG